jgi:ribulose-5-phosphate 4-epimerase/fuculose-1-phosphate aldolase
MLNTITAARRADMSEAEWKVRVDLAACYRLVELQGWSDMVSTHISARVPGPEHHFLINPHGMLFDEITASSLVKVDLEGKMVGPSDYAVNPAGFVIHSAIHLARPDAVFALHTHTAAGVGVASQRDGLLPITQQALAILGDVAYHGFEGPALRTDERARIATDLGDRRILILCNHGLLTVGRTAAEAFMAMYRAERACRFQLAFQQAGAVLSPIPEDIQESTAARGRKAFWGGGALDPNRLEWPALLRRLDRIDPSYKE